MPCIGQASGRSSAVTSYWRVLFGVGLTEKNATAPDDKIALVNFHNGIVASAALYEEIGRLGTVPS